MMANTDTENIKQLVKSTRNITLEDRLAFHYNIIRTITGNDLIRVQT